MNAELKAAAERWRDEDSYIEGPQAEHFRFRDQKMLTDWALQLLSDAPVTSEWLRETWGAEEVDALWITRGPRDADPLDVQVVRLMFDVFDPTKVYRWSVNGVRMSIPATQGAFTMLAYGLGLKPKEVSNESVL